MALTPVRCTLERFGPGPAGHVFVPALGGQDAAALRGSVQMAIVDRPAATKGSFQWKAGADDWLRNKSSLRLTIHHNKNDGLEEYLSLLEQDLRDAKEMLCDTGSVYVFAGQRESARVRLLLDGVFGRSNFQNEIIWAQQAGLRPAGRFTRSHQTVFLYRRGDKAFFNAGAAGRARGRLRSHMKLSEEGGRAVYTRESRGKVYRYHEDEIVSFGDVWTDISEIAARDEERMGWEGQRPEALLARMIAASTAPGDIVCDGFSGGGTTASAAQKSGRRALLAGAHPAERMLARRRLLAAGASGYEFAGCDSKPHAQPEVVASLSSGEVRLDIYHFTASQPAKPGTLLDDGLGGLEYWAAGRYAEGIFTMNAWSMRTHRQPTLSKMLPLGPGSGKPCLHLVDACGEQWFYLLD